MYCFKVTFSARWGAGVRTTEKIADWTTSDYNWHWPVWANWLFSLSVALNMCMTNSTLTQWSSLVQWFTEMNSFLSFLFGPPSFAVLRINSGPSARKCSTTELHLQPTATILDIYFFPQQTINKPRSNQSPNVPGIHPPHKSWGLVIWGKEKAPQHGAHQAVAAFCICTSAPLRLRR